jgi:hypothetical protein
MSNLCPSVKELWWQLELQIWCFLYSRIPARLQTNDCDWLTAGWWLWLIKQANTFCIFSQSTRADLEMACDCYHCWSNDTNLYILHFLLVHCLSEVLSFFHAAHCYFVSLQMLLEKFDMWVVMFKGKYLYSFTNYFSYFFPSPYIKLW